MKTSSQRLLHPKGEGVLVTGCSSGIGRATATHLAQRGFTVFATVRKAADAEGLRQLREPNLVPLCPFDLTRLDQVPGMVDQISAELAKRGQGGLYALVNNAGGGFIAPVELMDMGKFHVELQARILGPVALLQALLPGIREAGGRVVWIVTPALITTPYVASIHACDFAVACLARTLNLELKPWDIPNIMIRCGGIDTTSPARSNAELETAVKVWPPERYALYARALGKLQHEFAGFDQQRTPAEEVARVVERALCASRPKARYQVGHMSRMAALLEYLPQTLADTLIGMRN